MNRLPRFSSVLDVPAAQPQIAYEHLLTRLACETDVADVAADIQKAQHQSLPFLLVDVRDEQSYQECHLPHAINLPGRRIQANTTADWDRNQVIVTYCWGPACNGATKAAARLAQLGFQVKEMLGGIEYWRKEGGAVEGTLRGDAPLYWQMPASTYSQS